MRAMLRILAPSALFLSLLAPAGAATAAPDVPEGDRSFSIHVNDCDGNTIRVEGTLHAEYEIQWDLSVLVQVDAQGEALGSQGSEYVFNESHQERLSFGDYSMDYRARLISQGSAPDEVLLIHYELGSGPAYEIECSD